MGNLEAYGRKSGSVRRQPTHGLRPLLEPYHRIGQRGMVRTVILSRRILPRVLRIRRTCPLQKGDRRREVSRKHGAWATKTSFTYGLRHDSGSEETPMAKRHPKIAPGVVHDVPGDLRDALVSDGDALERWNDLTPLARNEWICWTISVKKPETRAQHVARVCSDLKDGKRRPCCWPGCKHR